MGFKKPKIKKISLRITLYFSVILILIALVISMLNIRIYSDELSDQMDNVASQKLSLVIGNLNQNINDIKLIHNVMLSDDAIKRAFIQTYENPNDSNIETLSYLLDNHHSTGSDRKYVTAIGVDGQIYNPISQFPAYQGLVTNNDFLTMKSLNQYQRFTQPNTFPLEYTEPTMVQRNNITLYAQYYDYETMTLLGYLAINFKSKDLFSNITTLITDTFSSAYILDENNELIHQFGDIPFELLPEDSQQDDIISIDQKDYSIDYKTLSSYERWHIVTLFDRDLISIETSRLNRYIYLTLAIALIIMLFISWFISQKITNPIREIIQSMGEFEKGQWPEPLVTSNEDEIKDLILGYNGMLTSFIKLTDSMIGQHEESKMIEIDLMKSQISLLEAQINPHFIHNTLNSMNYLAMIKGNDELSGIIQSFNKLLRMSMAIDISFITISQEIENIKDYVMIQNVRFDGVIQMSYEVDEDASIGRIPKLILQPLVENSIIHGILPKGCPGHINIHILRLDDELIITLRDDGVGIAPDQLKALLPQKQVGFMSKHIGVQNVYDRLKLYYGDTIKLTIDSTEDQGTKTTLHIPYED